MALDDMALVREFAANRSEPAFVELVARHISLVHSAAWRQVGNTHLAEEITQAVFIILARKAASLGPDTILSAWLYRTTRYASADALKLQRRRRRREQKAYMQSTLNEAPDANVWEQVAPLLDDAMASLAERDRAALVLRFFENKTAGKMAVALKVNEAVAQKRVTRALEKLRNIFSKRGVTLTATLIASAVATNSVQAAPVGLAATVAATATKGAAVGGLTLTLVKGALQLMAWTKAKVAIVTSTVLILTTTATVTVTSHFRNSHPPQTGRLKLPTGNVTPMVSYGDSRFAVFLASDGSLWSWGEASSGWPVLGLENTNIQNTVSLRRIGQEADWDSIVAAYSHCLAIKSDGTLWAWGENLRHQLGDRTEPMWPTPVLAVPGKDWKQAAAGANYSLALKNDGTLWAWGANGSGQLGTGNTQPNSKPRQVGTSTDWTKIWAGLIQSVGLKADGSLWFWGSRKGEGEATDNVLVPRRVAPDAKWVDACFGYYTVFAIKSDGTLWSWGRETRHYTDTSDTRSNLTPVQIGQAYDWQSCDSGAGGFYHLLTKRDGSLWALDASEHRKIKPDSEYKPIRFHKIRWQKDIAAFAAGGDNSGVVMTRDGEVWTWGKIIGVLSPEDYYGPTGEPLYPKSKIVKKPWQLSNIDSEY